jgi:hypothetical protein
MATLSPIGPREDFGPVEERATNADDINLSFATFKVEVDMGPILQSLPGGSCQYPHWGLLTKGRVTVRYDDGTSEVIEAGDAYYMTRGHVPVFASGSEVVMFSPVEELKATEEAIQAFLAATQGAPAS